MLAVLAELPDAVPQPATHRAGEGSRYGYGAVMEFDVSDGSEFPVEPSATTKNV